MIDTENKRRSVAGYCGAIVYPRPDGSVGARDREHVAWLYAGIAAAAPAIVLATSSRISITMGIQI